MLSLVSDLLLLSNTCLQHDDMIYPNNTDNYPHFPFTFFCFPTSWKT